MALLSGAFLALGFMLCIQPLRRSWDDDRSATARFGASPVQDIKMILKHRGLRFVSLGSFSFSAMQVCLTTFAVTMLVTDVELTLIEAGFVLAVLQVSGVSGRIFWGWVADHLGDGNKVLIIITVITILAAILTGLLSTYTPVYLVYLILAIFGFTAVGWNGVYLAEVARLSPPELIGSATGAALVITNFGVVVGPIVFMGIYPVLGTFTSTFTVFSIVSVMGLVCVWRAGKSIRR